LYAALPAVARVVHATENYFHFEGSAQFLLTCQRAAVRSSDLTVAVSDGVAASFRENVPGARIEVVTNGCDYEEYSRYRPDEHLRAMAKEWERVAVYGGNINGRLDYVLLEGCVQANPKTLHAFFGPVAALDADDAVRWERLLRQPNVRYLGSVDPGTLPGLYGAADVGLIPYKKTPLLVDNGFPLKALEMCATGLPVVSTLMKPIVGLTDGLVVVSDHSSFLERLSATSRASLTEAQKEDMRRVCQAHDYDRKFATVLSLLESEREAAPPTRTRFDVLLADNFGPWTQLGVREWQRRSTPPRGSWPEPGRLLSRPASAGRPREAGRVLKGAMAAGAILRDSTTRALLLSGIVRKCRGQSISLSGLLNDLIRLGILRREIVIGSRAGHGFTTRMRYDLEEHRLFVETLKLEDVVAGTPPGPDGQLLVRGPLDHVIWDHSAMGTVVPIVVGGRQAGVFMGPEGRYEFHALRALAQTRHELVWEAFGRAKDR
jgi:hypothetical protein